MRRYQNPSPSVPHSDALLFTTDGFYIGGFKVAQGFGPGLDPTDRLKTLLAITFNKRLDPSRLEAVRSAAAFSRQGDHALANLRLTMSQLIRIPNAVDLAERLAMADMILFLGMPPDFLLKELNLDQESDRLAKYDPN